MMNMNKWENLTMKELESLAGKIAMGEQVEYTVGEHKFETTFDEARGLLRTVHINTLEVIESEKDEWSYADLLSALIRHLLMATDD